MGLLAKCPKCSTTYMPGQPCPSCNYMEGADGGESQMDMVAEYSRRNSRHQFAYGAFMSRGLAVGLMGLAFPLGCWVGLLQATFLFLFGLAVAILAQLYLFANQQYRELHCPGCDTRL